MTTILIQSTSAKVHFYSLWDLHQFLPAVYVFFLHLSAVSLTKKFKTNLSLNGMLRWYYTTSSRQWTIMRVKISLANRRAIILILHFSERLLIDYYFHSLVFSSASFYVFQHCQDYEPSLLCWLAPSIYWQFNSIALNNKELVHLIVSCCDSRQLQELVCLIIQGIIHVFS